MRSRHRAFRAGAPAGAYSSGTWCSRRQRAASPKRRPARSLGVEGRRVESRGAPRGSRPSRRPASRPEPRDIPGGHPVHLSRAATAAAAAGTVACCARRGPRHVGRVGPRDHARPANALGAARAAAASRVTRLAGCAHLGSRDRGRGGGGRAAPGGPAPPTGRRRPRAASHQCRAARDRTARDRARSWARACPAASSTPARRARMRRRSAGASSAAVSSSSAGAPSTRKTTCSASSATRGPGRGPASSSTATTPRWACRRARRSSSSSSPSSSSSSGKARTRRGTRGEVVVRDAAREHVAPAASTRRGATARAGCTACSSCGAPGSRRARHAVPPSAATGLLHARRRRAEAHLQLVGRRVELLTSVAARATREAAPLVLRLQVVAAPLASVRSWPRRWAASIRPTGRRRRRPPRPPAARRGWRRAQALAERAHLRQPGCTPPRRAPAAPAGPHQRAPRLGRLAPGRRRGGGRAPRL